MKNLIFTISILIILFKTGNVLSNNNIFNVNNVEISEESSKNKEKLINQSFRKAFDQLTNRLLLKEDYRKISSTSMNEIKKLISYYQIKDFNDNEKIKKSINISFDKDRMHNFFYQNNLLYSDIIDTEVMLFPLLKLENQYFIYNQNFFYENWIKENPNNLINYILPAENIENIQKINLKKENIFDLDITDFFKEYNAKNVIFAYIEIKKDSADIFLKTKIEGKIINKNLSFKNKSDLNQNEFFNRIIINIKNNIVDIIKSQNLIDVRTPSFLNIELRVEKKNKNLFELNNRLKNIDLIDDFYVQEIHKDYVLIKIKYLGKISKIIDKFKIQNINLIMKEGKWQLSFI